MKAKMKDWNGNKSSIRVMRGLDSNWRNDDREINDYYATDPEAVEKFINTFNVFSKGNLNIWEPACGNGNISEVLLKHGHKVFSTDLINRGYGIGGINFLTANNDKNFSIIITNPPYSLAEEFVLHALDILPDNGMYICLQNITYLSGKKRFNKIYSNRYLHELYIYTGRVTCYKNNERTIKHGAVNYAWFIYKKNARKYPQIHWIV